MCRMLVVDDSQKNLLQEKTRMYVHLLGLPVELHFADSADGVRRSLNSGKRIDILMTSAGTVERLQCKVQPWMKQVVVGDSAVCISSESKLLLSPDSGIETFYRAITALVPETAKNAEDIRKTNRWYGNNVSMQDRILDVLKIIKEEYSDDISLEYLAGRVYTSPCYLSTLFHKFVGLSPLAYLNDYRMRRAVQLLLESDCSVTSICTMVGYRNLPYFCTCFKRKYNLTPAQFREKYASPDAISA